MKYPEFIDLVNEYDFICLTECKTDDLDIIDIPGYTFHMKNRKTNAKVKSGGIAFGYKSHYDKYIHPLESNSKLISWYKISMDLCKTSEDVIIGNVYVPPENSLYKVTDAFNELEDEFLRLSVNHKLILLNGDFNSRTANDFDFVEIEDNIRCPPCNDYNYANMLSQLDMSYVRQSQDKNKNNYGNQLLTFCRNNNMFILNGRVKGDRQGLFTCRQSSVVDYFICTHDLLCNIDSLYVLDFSSLYSDVHSPVCLNFMTNLSKSNGDTNSYNKSNSGIKKFKKWNFEKNNDYVESIDLDKIQQLEHELSHLNIDNLNQNSIDNLVSEVNTILTDSAEKVFGSYLVNDDRNREKLKRENKPWFNQECWLKRKAYRIAKRRYKIRKGVEDRDIMKSSEKKYKKEMNKAINEHRRNMRKKLKNLKTSNTKEYWNIINTRQPRKNSGVPIDTFYDFFKTLNASNDEDDIPLILPDDDELNEIINDKITENEILKCIKNLKNSKSPGDDLIINEYIKSTSQLLMPIYVKLFNIIFDTGTIPETWLTGNIIPFYKNKGEKNDPQNYRPITILSCFGKLFTSILNERLGNFLENFLLLNENQNGFRKGYSTIDSIMTLHFLFELLRLKKKSCIAPSSILQRHSIRYGVKDCGQNY